jgi:hypothetical protein
MTPDKYNATAYLTKCPKIVEIKNPKKGNFEKYTDGDSR